MLAPHAMLPVSMKDETAARRNLKKLRDLKDPDITRLADSLERLMDGASEGGKARAKKLSKKRRSEIARTAANARWSEHWDKRK